MLVISIFRYHLQLLTVSTITTLPRNHIHIMVLIMFCCSQFWKSMVCWFLLTTSLSDYEIYNQWKHSFSQCTLHSVMFITILSPIKQKNLSFYNNVHLKFLMLSRKNLQNQDRTVIQNPVNFSPQLQY